MSVRRKKTMDGNAAAAYASYAFIDAAIIYPITPSSPMDRIKSYERLSRQAYNEKETAS